MAVRVNAELVGEVAAVFLRLGTTAFGGPAAHVALIERECVQRRRWIPRDEFLDLLGASSLIPGPTSTELVMHLGRRRAGWPGLVAGGLAFMAPAVVLVSAIAAVYVHAGRLPAVQGIAAAMQPVVVIVVLQALVPLARAAIGSVPLAMMALSAGILAAAGIPELRVLLLAGVAHAVATWRRTAAVAAVVLVTMAVVSAQGAEPAATAGGVFAYFVRVGSLLFGSGYVLLPVLQGDLVERLGWLTSQQLIDAIAAGQATPGPVFTTATFVGYVIGGPWHAAAATAGIFLPAFVFASISSVMLHRLRGSRRARAFLDGVNAAAVALIAVVVVTLARAAFTSWTSIAIALCAAAGIFAFRLNPAIALLGAALFGALFGAR